MAKFQGKFYVFRVLVFGSGSAPTVWGRYAAWLGRSTCAVLNRFPFRMQMYVDDPVYSASGQQPEARLTIASALLWAACAGFPFAWHKCDGGCSLRWVGAVASVSSDTASIIIPEDTAEKLAAACKKMLGTNTVSRKSLQEFAGRMSFVAALVLTIRPFLDCLWAALSRHLTVRQGRMTAATLPAGGESPN